MSDFYDLQVNNKLFINHNTKTSFNIDAIPFGISFKSKLNFDTKIIPSLVYMYITLQSSFIYCIHFEDDDSKVVFVFTCKDYQVKDFKPYADFKYVDMRRISEGVFPEYD